MPKRSSNFFEDNAAQVTKTSPSKVDYSSIEDAYKILVQASTSLDETKQGASSQDISKIENCMDSFYVMHEEFKRFPKEVQMQAITQLEEATHGQSKGFAQLIKFINMIGYCDGKLSDSTHSMRP